VNRKELAQSCGENFNFPNNFLKMSISIWHFNEANVFLILKKTVEIIVRDICLTRDVESEKVVFCVFKNHKDIAEIFFNS
jgi:hypothetical protein